MRKPELLAPAGNLEKLQIAVLYGADAVYLGGKAYGLRAFSDNFTLEEMREGVDFAHARGVKVYVTVNIFPHNDDLEGLPEYLKNLAAIGIDAVIFSDPGVFRLAREVAPDMPLHVSTQANNTNWASALFWQEHGVERIVLARELSLGEIREIRRRVTAELEVFVHGAMCIAYSGRCLLSHYLAGRDANRGECAHPCRWRYALMEETRPGQLFPVVEDERGTYVFNSKDLCMVAYIPELIAAGLDSFKIEGRMKSIHYVAAVTRVYRQAIDAYMRAPEAFRVEPGWLEELAKISHREYTTGFYFGKTTAADQIYTSASYTQTHEFVGVVREYLADRGVAVVEQRSPFRVGDVIEFMCPRGGDFSTRITALYTPEGDSVESAPHPQQLLHLPVAQPVAPFTLLRRKMPGER